MNAIAPSMSAETTPWVMACWIGCTAPRREKMSPTCRFSKIGGQALHVADQVAHDLEAEKMPEDLQRPSAQSLGRGLHDDQRTERQRDHQQKILVRVENGFVDDELDLKRRRECRDLQHGG